MLAQQRRDAVLRALVPSGAATLDALAATGLRVGLAERPPAKGAAS